MHHKTKSDPRLFTQGFASNSSQTEFDEAFVAFRPKTHQKISSQRLLVQSHHYHSPENPAASTKRSSIFFLFPLCSRIYRRSTSTYQLPQYNLPSTQFDPGLETYQFPTD